MIRKTATLIASAALAAATLAAPTAAAQELCPETGRFAVGGYPRTGIVPDGFETVYTPGGIFPWESGGYNHGQNVGAANLVDTVDDFAARCSGAIELRGHSYGAGVVSTAVETIGDRDYAGRVSVHLTGNPRHPGGIEDTYRGITLAPGLTFRGAARVPASVASYVDDCNYGRDYICHAPHLLWDPLGALAGVFGYLGTGHTYPQEVTNG